MVPVMTRWACYADNKIGGYRLLKRKIAVLTFDHCSAELPCDIVCLLPGILWGDYGCSCDLLFTGLRQSLDGVPIATSSGYILPFKTNYGQVNACMANYVIQDNKMVFNYDFDKQKITIPYIGFKEDEYGLPMVLESHVEAIGQYIQFRIAKQSRFKQKEFRLSETAIDKEERLWHRMCRNARAKDAEPSDIELRGAAEIYNDPFSGINNGLWIYDKPEIFGLIT